MHFKSKKRALSLAMGLAGLVMLNTSHAAGFVFIVPELGLKPPVVLGVSPSAFNFGSVAVGQSLSQTFTVANTGGATATGLQYAAPAGYGMAGDCGDTLAPGASCSELVTFTPSAGQTYQGYLTVTSGTQSGSAALKGLGLSSSDSLSAGSLTFTAQQVGTTSAAQGVTVTNTGNTTLSISQISTTGSFAATQNCGASLVAGGVCSVNVTFTPTVINANSGALSIVSSLGTQTVSLSGTGQQAVIAASPTSLSYSSVIDGQSSSAQSFTLTNNGNIAATSLSIAAPSGYSQTSTCGSSLAVGASCTVSVTFSPTTVGTVSGNVTVTSSAATVNVGVSGTGAAACTASPTTITQNSDYSMSVPAGCGHMAVNMWAAGGGGSTSVGGGGGYVGATLAVASGNTVLVRVGQGGSLVGSGYLGAFGGGGSFLYLNGTLELAAGGGGGGGGGAQGNASDNSSPNGTAGGAGGGSTGIAGTNQTIFNTYAGWGGNPGTQSAGGAATAGTASTNTGGNGGSYLTGGGYGTTATNYGGGGGSVQGGAGNGAGGGGGGGFYGGGAGASGGYWSGGSGGGGGSGYVAAGISGTLTAGSGATPGNSGSSLRGSAGTGGSNAAGQGGIAVLTWSQ